MRVRIASRKSDLARLQSHTVAKELKKHFPDLVIELQFRESLGDINLTNPLWKMPEKGVFTEDFYKDLCDSTTDLVVHSWKDLPIVEKPDTFIVATLPREDARDLILFKKSHFMKWQTEKKLQLYSSSPRREYNLTPFLKEYLPFSPEEIIFHSVRGNIQTRVKKLLESEEIDALVVAKAALDRLMGTTDEEFYETRLFLQNAFSLCEPLIAPLSLNPTAAAQGALAIEVKRSRKDLIEMLGKINCEQTFYAVTKERDILKKHGGGCHQKIGVSIARKHYGDIFSLRGFTETGVILKEYELLKKEEHFQQYFNSEDSPKDSRLSKNASSTREGNFTVFPGFTDDHFNRKHIEISDEMILSAFRKTTTFKDKKKSDPKLVTNPPENPQEKTQRLFISRKNALPKPLYDRMKTIALKEGASLRICTAGLKTWKALVKEGIFVNETTDSLGESEWSSAPYLKLTHSDGYDKEMNKNSSQDESYKPEYLYTYSLKIDLSAPSSTKNLFHKESILLTDIFYWMSFTQFMAIYEKVPEILNKKHVVGPGNTYTLLKEKFGESISLQIQLSFEHFNKKFNQKLNRKINKQDGVNS